LVWVRVWVRVGWGVGGGGGGVSGCGGVCVFLCMYMSLRNCVEQEKPFVHRIVYITEAHPCDEWFVHSSWFHPQNKAVVCNQQRTPEERCQAASELHNAFQLEDGSIQVRQVCCPHNCVCVCVLLKDGGIKVKQAGVLFTPLRRADDSCTPPMHELRPSQQCCNEALLWFAYP